MAMVPAVVSGGSRYLPEILSGRNRSPKVANPLGTASSLSCPGTSKGGPDSRSQPARLALGGPVRRGQHGGAEGVVAGDGGKARPGAARLPAILGYGLWSTPDGARAEDHAWLEDRARPNDHERPATEPGQRADPTQPPADLPILLSRVLLAFAIEFEQEFPVSLAISANVLRVLDQHGVRVRDLPGLSA